MTIEDQSLKSEVRDFWDKASCEEVYATGESEQERYESQSRTRYQLQPWIHEFAKFDQGSCKDVLEVGVGMGADHIQWAKSQPNSLTGIDLTSRAINHTKKRLSIYGLESDVRMADAENMPFEDASFDIVYSWGVIHHSPDPAKAASEICRVLRPGGVARVMIYHKYSLTGYMLWGRYGLLRGRPFRSLDDLYHHHLESPGTKAFTVKQAKEMFAACNSVRAWSQVSPGDLLEGAAGQNHQGVVLSVAKAVWPRFLLRRLFKNHGLMLFIEARKDAPKETVKQAAQATADKRVRFHGPANLPEKPLFIVGHPRSGTTLLRFLLSSQSRIHIPPETGFLPNVMGFHGRDLSRQEVQSLIEKIGRLNREWENVVHDYDAFFAALPQPNLTFALDALYRKRMESTNAVRWGDKTPIFVRYIEQINDVFPNAQFIHIIRDGRDATLSALKKWQARYRYLDSYYLLKNWVRNVAAGQAAGKWLGAERYYEVRYENLVEHTSQAVQGLCEFLGESFEPALLDQTILARNPKAECHHAEVTKPISDASVGRWMTEMTPFDQKLAERIAGRKLRELGYDTGLVGMTPVENLRLARLAARFSINDSLRSALHAIGVLTISREKAKQ